MSPHVSQLIYIFPSYLIWSGLKSLRSQKQRTLRKYTQETDIKSVREIETLVRSGETDGLFPTHI